MAARSLVTYVGHVAITSGAGLSGTENVSHPEPSGKDTVNFPPCGAFKSGSIRGVMRTIYASGVSEALWTTHEKRSTFDTSLAVIIDPESASMMHQLRSYCQYDRYQTRFTKGAERE